MSYTLDNIIQDCLIEKAKVLNTARGKSTEAKMNIYAQTWVALNAWIEYRLAKQKGACLNGFATFGWEMLAQGDQTHCRPVFILTDDFVKTYQVKRPRIFHTPLLTPVEDTNFSQLAIKFSPSLTKDMVFMAVKDLVRMLGQYISSGREVEVQFTFGVLYAKERKVKFSYNTSRLLRILPALLEKGEEEGTHVYANTTDPLLYIEPPDTPTPLPTHQSTLTAATTQPESSPRANVPSTHQNTHTRPVLPPLPLSHTSHTNPPHTTTHTTTHTTSQTKPHTPADHTPADMHPSLMELLNTLELHKKSKGTNTSLARERVLKLAFERCLKDMHDQASLEDQRKFEELKSTFSFNTRTLEEKDKHLQLKLKLKSDLDAQLRESKVRQAEEKKEERERVAAFILPPTAGLAPSPLGGIVGEDGQVVNSRQRIAKDLAKQIELNAQHRVAERRRVSEEERRAMQQLRLENELLDIQKRAKQLENQKNLVVAWEREGHIKNVKRLQSRGQSFVSDYIHKHLDGSTTHQSTHQSSTHHGEQEFYDHEDEGYVDDDMDREVRMADLPPSLDEKLKMSIGYDPRTGKRT